MIKFLEKKDLIILLRYNATEEWEVGSPFLKNANINADENGIVKASVSFQATQDNLNPLIENFFRGLMEKNKDIYIYAGIYYLKDGKEEYIFNGRVILGETDIQEKEGRIEITLNLANSLYFLKNEKIEKKKEDEEVIESLDDMNKSILDNWIDKLTIQNEVKNDENLNTAGGTFTTFLKKETITNELRFDRDSYSVSHFEYQLKHSFLTNKELMIRSFETKNKIQLVNVLDKTIKTFNVIETDFFSYVCKITSSNIKSRKFISIGLHYSRGSSYYFLLSDFIIYDLDKETAITYKGTNTAIDKCLYYGSPTIFSLGATENIICATTQTGEIFYGYINHEKRTVTWTKINVTKEKPFTTVVYRSKQGGCCVLTSPNEFTPFEVVYQNESGDVCIETYDEAGKEVLREKIEGVSKGPLLNAYKDGFLFIETVRTKERYNSTTGNLEQVELDPGFYVIDILKKEVKKEEKVYDNELKDISENLTPNDGELLGKTRVLYNSFDKFLYATSPTSILYDKGYQQSTYFIMYRKKIWGEKQEKEQVQTQDRRDELEGKSLLTNATVLAKKSGKKIINYNPDNRTMTISKANLNGLLYMDIVEEEIVDIKVRNPKNLTGVRVKYGSGDGSGEVTVGIESCNFEEISDNTLTNEGQAIEYAHTKLSESTYWQLDIKIPFVNINYFQNVKIRLDRLRRGVFIGYIDQFTHEFDTEQGIIWTSIALKGYFYLVDK